jgi:hypothetical protein
VFLTKTLYVPGASPLNTFDACQLVLPSIEYSKLAPVAVIVITPSFIPQLLGFVDETFVITGCILSINVMFASLTIQVPSALRTLIL